MTLGVVTKHDKFHLKNRTEMNSLITCLDASEKEKLKS